MKESLSLVIVIVELHFNFAGKALRHAEKTALKGFNKLDARECGTRRSYKPHLRPFEIESLRYVRSQLLILALHGCYTQFLVFDVAVAAD